MPMGASLTKRPGSRGAEHARSVIDSARGTPVWSWSGRRSGASQFGQLLSPAAL
jgi:hypothetical protein